MPELFAASSATIATSGKHTVGRKYIHHGKRWQFDRKDQQEREKYRKMDKFVNGFQRFLPNHPIGENVAVSQI